MAMPHPAPHQAAGAEYLRQVRVKRKLLQSSSGDVFTSSQQQLQSHKEQRNEEAKETSSKVRVNATDEAGASSWQSSSANDNDNNNNNRTAVTLQRTSTHLPVGLRLITSYLALATCAAASRQARPLNVHPNQQQQLLFSRQLAALRSQLSSAGPMELGSACLPGDQCARWIENGHCKLDALTCACLPQHVALNATTCLAPALLGYQCLLDEQCQRKVPEAVCGPDKRCTCPPHLEPYRKDKCLAASKINDYCLTDRQCQLRDPHSHCKWKIPNVYGLCKCPPNYKAITWPNASSLAKAETRCVPRLGDSCLSSDECQLATAHSECRLPEASEAALTTWRTSGVSPKRCLCTSASRQSANKMHCDLVEPTAPIALSATEKMDAKHQYELVIPTATTLQTTTEVQVSPLPTKTGNKEQAAVRLSSLGKPCNSHADCQARDQHSHCLAGRCECIAPTSRCSSNSTGCHRDTFQCRNGQCISWYFVCDNFKNCDDGSDEDECQPTSNQLCPMEAFQCDNGQCIARGKQCNGKADCSDSSDERHCFAGTPEAAHFSAATSGKECPPRTFQCANGHCLPGYVFCNAVEDCADGSDESPSLCERSIRRKWTPIAARNTTTAPAPAATPTSDSPLLKADRLAINKMLATLQQQRRQRPPLSTAQPIHSRQRQSRVGNLPESPADECPRWAFTCRNGKCRSSAILCSAVDGCGDNSDEDQCQVCQCEAPTPSRPPTEPLATATFAT